MIRCCICSGGSSSLLVNHKRSEGSKACQSCGGKLSLDGRGALSTSMLSTIGLELSKVIDPQLTWKTTSKGRQRAVRRARTSFTGGNKKKPTSKGSKETEDLTDKDSNRTSDMAVSEFEKLGVSVLGRRFSDTVESVPIKKRRFLLTRSPSPPHQSSSHSDDSDQIQGVQSATCKEAASNTLDHGLPLDSNSDVGFELGQERSFVDEKTNLENLSENLCDFADFSGISMLAAAACNSNGVRDATNDEDSVCREPISEEKEVKIHKDVLDGKPQTPQELSTKLVMPGEESKVIKVAGLCSLDTPMRSSFDVPDKTTRVESSSRDVRLHWDLNTVMDAWESNSIDILNSESHDHDNFVDVHSKKLGSVEPQIGSADSRCALEHTVNRDLGDLRDDNRALEDIKMQEKPELSCNTFIADHNEGSACFSDLQGDSVQEDYKLEDALVSMVGVAEKAKTLDDQENRILTKGVSSPVRGAPIPACDSYLGTGAAGGEVGAGFDSVVEAEFSHPPLVHCEKASFGQTLACKPHNIMDQIPELVHQGNMNTTFAADLDEHVINCSPSDVHKGPGTIVRNQADMRRADSGNGTADQCSEVNCLAEQSSSVMVYSDICNDMKNTSDVSGEIAHTDPVENNISSMFESHVFNSQELPDHDELLIGSAHAGEHGTMDAHLKLQDNKLSLLMDRTLKTIEVDSCVHIDSEFAACSSPTMKLDMVAVPSLNVALNSNGVHKTYGDGYGTSSGQVAVEDHSDCDYYSDASQVDISQPTGMEKVEFLRDEDYQYEDGEFRESFVNRWGEDGPEDGETEYVDYGSDNRETDIFEDASDFHASVSLHVDGVEGKTGVSDVKCDTEYEAQARMEVQDSVSLPQVTCLLDAGSPKAKDVGRKLERDAEDMSVYGGVITKVGENQCLNEGVAARKASQLDTLRTKTSGWDRLPEGDTCSESRVVISGVDSARRNIDAALSISNAGGPFRRVMQSPPRGDISSRVERAKSSDSIRRKDKLSDKASRPNQTDLDSSRGERDTGAPRLNGRGGSSQHMHGRGKPDCWARPPDHCDANQHDPHGCYGPTNFTQPTSTNAAAATVAKLESNGFVVAADGTIFKAGGVRPASQVHRRSTKELLHNVQHSVTGSSLRDGSLRIPLGIGNSRELSPGRYNSIDGSRVSSGRCGPGVPNTGVRERYRRAMPDNSRDVHIPLHHQLPRREHSISPHRRHLHRSRTRSPVRSRTRSPHMHSSTKVRSDGGVNSGPGLHLRGRSPHFKSQLRTQRHRSGYQSDLAEHIVSYDPSPRNHNSPAHASRWVDGRNGLPEHFREQEPNRFSGRSPPSRVFVQNKRLDLIDSPGRAKTNEYHRSMDYGTFPDDFDGVYDGPGDSRRGFGNRYEMLHPVRQYNTDGNTKSFRYDAGNDYRVHNTQPRSSEFQRRVSPREFNRGIGNQVGDSVRRVTEGKANVRYPRDGKHNAGFKSFGVRDRDDNITPRRRPPL